MKKLASSLFAIGLSLAAGLPAMTGMAGAAQPSAFAPPPIAAGQQAPVENAQYYRHWEQWPEREWRDPSRYRYDLYRPRHWGPGPGYRHPPRHYRPRHYRPAPVYRGGNPHVRWCYNRYRSYRAYDNTFQPNYGPRRQCYSPYL